jgi:hypothetical protein
MYRSLTRHIARAAVVTTAVLAAGLVGMSPAHAGQPSESQASDLVVSGGIDVFSLGEIGGAAVTADVATLKGPSASTTVRFTLVRVTRITAGGQTRYVNLLNSPTVTVTGDVPAIAGRTPVETYAVIPNAQYRHGLTRITACVDPDRTVFEYSDTNNCRSEIRTI